MPLLLFKDSHTILYFFLLILTTIDTRRRKPKYCLNIIYDGVFISYIITGVLGFMVGIMVTCILRQWICKKHRRERGTSYANVSSSQCTTGDDMLQATDILPTVGALDIDRDVGKVKKYLKQLDSHQLKQLFEELGLSHSTLNDKYSHGVQVYADDLICAWILGRDNVLKSEEYPGGPTMMNLKKALKRFGHNGIADKIREERLLDIIMRGGVNQWKYAVIITILLVVIVSVYWSVIFPAPTPTLTSHYADYLTTVYTRFSTAHSDKLPFTSNTVYVNLALVLKERMKQEDIEMEESDKLTSQAGIDSILDYKKKIEMNDILKDKKTRLVVIEGPPGIGKSTLAWQLCRQWHTLESLKHFSLVLFLSLRDEKVQTAKDVSDLLYHPDKRFCKRVESEIEDLKGAGVLFVFDGFDEFPAQYRKKSLVMDIINGHWHLPDATVLVTTRPSGSAELQIPLQMNPSKHIEIIGFSSKEIIEYAFERLDGISSVSEFLEYLSINPAVMGIMYVPLNSAIVMELYIESHLLGKPAPRTQTELYTELALSLMSRYLNETGHPLADNLPDRLEDLRNETDIYDELIEIGRLAYEKRLSDEIIFKEIPEGCSGLGLLVEHKTFFLRREAKKFNFFHLTLQEYMSAFYISQLNATDQKRILEESLDKMELVWIFVTGLTRMESIGWNKFITFVKHSYSERFIFKDIDRYLVHFFYEAQDNHWCNSSLFQNSPVCYKTFKSTDYDLYALGYCISICEASWDIEVHSYKGSLSMFGLGLRSIKNAGGSIERLDITSLLFPSKPCVRLELNFIPRHFLHNIKTLNLCFCSLDQDGFDKLTEIVPYMPNLISLDIIKHKGDVESLVKLSKALFKYTKLEKLEVEKNILGDGDLDTLELLISHQRRGIHIVFST